MFKFETLHPKIDDAIRDQAPAQTQTAHQRQYYRDHQEDKTLIESLVAFTAPVLMNPSTDAFSPIYTRSSSLLLPSISPASSPPPSSRNMLFLGNLKPKTLVLLPLPCITLILVCLWVLLVDIWREKSIINSSLKTRDLSPWFRTWTAENSDVTLETGGLSRDTEDSDNPDYDPGALLSWELKQCRSAQVERIHLV